jgi:hypothetical protein
MQRIRKQFGDKFADALAKCPTLVADLAELRRHGVKIRKVTGHCQAYSNHFHKTIHIGSRCGLTYKLVALAHEKVHVLDSVTPHPLPGKTGRQEFIDMCLNAETDAIVHEVQVVAELIAAGYRVDAHSMKWYRRFQRGGRVAVRKAIESAVTSNTGESYPEYYGAWYDEVVKPQFRLPQHRLHGSGVQAGRTITLPSFDLSLAHRPPHRGQGPCPRFRPFCPEPAIHLDKRW